MNWTARAVAWHQRALERSDYATRVLGAFEPLGGASYANQAGALWWPGTAT